MRRWDPETGVESCDDGNEVDNDGCRTTCETARCGDGVRRTDLSQGQEGYEACDDGNNIPNDGCNNECVVGLCGNGLVDAGEQCDDANQSNTDGCTNNCRTARCGDGHAVRGSKRGKKATRLATTEPNGDGCVLQRLHRGVAVILLTTT